MSDESRVFFVLFVSAIAYILIYFVRRLNKMEKEIVKKIDVIIAALEIDYPPESMISVEVKKLVLMGDINQGKITNI